MEDFWDSVYERGMVYGKDPSICALRVEELMEERIGTEILDIGCGYGRDAKYLAYKGYKVQGIDPSGNAITMAMKNFPVGDFKFGSFSKIPYRGNSFDCVMSHLTYHMLKENERKKALQEVNRVLKPKGLLVFTVLSFHDPISIKERKEHPEYGEYNEAFDRKMIEKEFKEFNVSKIEELDVTHMHPKGKKVTHKIFLIVAESRKHAFISS
mgnify:CR=1 FL=1